MLKKGERGLGHHSTHYWRWCLCQAMPKKCGAGQELAPVPILLKIVSLSLSAILVNCRSQHVSGLRSGKKSTKSNAILFDVGANTIPKQNYLASIFDSFDAHSSVNYSSKGRCLLTHFETFFKSLQSCGALKVLEYIWDISIIGRLGLYPDSTIP